MSSEQVAIVVCREAAAPGTRVEGHALSLHKTPYIVTVVNDIIYIIRVNDVFIKVLIVLIKVVITTIVIATFIFPSSS